jgi:FdrA protein
VLLFSDNVPLAAEIELKELGASVGHLVMGPGAGTAALGGCGLGFANVVRHGRVGIVAAAGTGAQEAMSLLDRWGEGVTQVVGVGGRDLSADVGGRMAALAVRALAQDPATEIVLLVSKPPSPGAARAVVHAAGATPIVAALVGLGPDEVVDGATAVTRTLEGGVRATLTALGLAPPDLGDGARHDVEQALAGLAPSGRSSEACTPEAPSATRPSPCSSPGWDRSGPTRPSTSNIACRRRPAATPAWTWVRRSTPRAGPTP